MVGKEGDDFGYYKKGSKETSVSTVVAICIGAFVFGLVVAWIFLPDFGNFADIDHKEENSFVTCGDGSFNGTCSLNKPYYCDGKELISKPEFCGCPSSMKRDNGNCTSDYEYEPKSVTFDYVLRGEKKNITMVVYGGVAEYLHEQDKNIFYTKGEKISRRDFKLNSIDNEVQKQYVFPLVKEIQNLAPGNKVEQARIAVSLVQNIPYGDSGQTVSFSGGTDVNYSRFPYEVLYDEQGICGEKTELMALLLREIGYGTSFFFWPMENHEALGIKCPVEESFQNTGYCFVESTMPAIISDYELEYKGVGKLSNNVETYLLSEGFSLPENIYEYDDRDKLQNIKRNDMFRKGAYDNLKEKYGLKGEYRVT